MQLALAAEFPSPTREEWAALVDGVLRKAGRLAEDAATGSGVEKLVRETLDGIPVRPLYTADDAPSAEATGVLGFRLGPTGADRVLWLRGPWEEAVTWGHRDKALLRRDEGGGLALGPRESFERWAEGEGRVVHSLGVVG